MADEIVTSTAEVVPDLTTSGGGSGDIEGVTAGAGLTGGGTSGSVTLNVAAADSTITVNADSIQVGAINTANIADAQVSLAKLANLAAVSVIGNATNAAAAPTAITGTGSQALRLNGAGTALSFGLLANDNIDAAAAISVSKLGNIAGASVLGRSATGIGPMAAITGTTIGDVLTVQADNTVAFSAPSGGGGGGYSTIERPNGTPVTQRAIMSFTTEFAVADNVDTTDVSLATNGVAFTKLAQLAAVSVLGVTGGSTANMAAITAGADGAVLRRTSSSALAFGTLVAASFADSTISGARMTGFTNLALTIGNSSGQLTSAGITYDSGTGFMTHAASPFRIRAGNNNPYIELSTAGGTQIGYGTASNVTCGGSQTVISGAVANLALGGAGSFGGSSCAFFLTNAGTVPSTNPTGGGLIYCEAGALKYRGTSGTVTTLGPA